MTRITLPSGTEISNEVAEQIHKEVGDLGGLEEMNDTVGEVRWDVDPDLCHGHDASYNVSEAELLLEKYDISYQDLLFILKK